MNENFIWYRNGCKKAIPEVKQVLKMVNIIKASNDEIKERLDKIENKIGHQQSELGIQYNIDQALYDHKERETRKNNIIIYNIKENSAADAEENKAADKAVVEEICRELDVEHEFDGTSFSRLGERKDTGKPRPIKVQFNNETAKRKSVTKGTDLKKIEKFKSVKYNSGLHIQAKNDEQSNESRSSTEKS